MNCPKCNKRMKFSRQSKEFYLCNTCGRCYQVKKGNLELYFDMHATRWDW